MDTAFSATYYVDPNGGIHDQQEYTEAGDWLDVWGNAIPAVHIETGSYVGTGTVGANNPNSLSFGFVPSFVFIMAKDYQLWRGIFLCSAMTAEYSTGVYFAVDYQNGSMTQSYFNAKLDGNVLSWYASTNGAASQLNNSGATYNYIAIG